MSTGGATELLWGQRGGVTNRLKHWQITVSPPTDVAWHGLSDTGVAIFRHAASDLGGRCIEACCAMLRPMTSRLPSKPFPAAALAVILFNCGPTSRAHWTSRGPSSSAYSATVDEGTYNDGDSITYALRFEKTESGPGGGWFVKKPIDGDSARSQRPELFWTTPKDLTVIVHTKHIAGHLVQRFVNPSGDDGSLTFDYRADGLER